MEALKIKAMWRKHKEPENEFGSHTLEITIGIPHETSFIADWMDGINPSEAKEFIESVIYSCSPSIIVDNITILRIDDSTEDSFPVRAVIALECFYEQLHKIITFIEAEYYEEILGLGPTKVDGVSYLNYMARE
jgi:hypothetical protein